MGGACIVPPTRKYMKVLVGVNTLTSVDQMVYLSHCQFWTRTIKQYPDDTFMFYAPYRMSIDHMRNASVKVALENECDYLFFIDDDVVIEPHTFKSLYECKLDVAMALTFIRGYPFDPMFFKFDELKQNLKRPHKYEDLIAENGIIPCDAIGCACVLFKTWMFKEIKEPWFVTCKNCTEDVYFCLQMHDTIKTPFTIGVDTKVPTAHKLGAEYISPFNRNALLAYYETLDPKRRDEKPEPAIRNLSTCPDPIFKSCPDVVLEKKSKEPEEEEFITSCF